MGGWNSIGVCSSHVVNVRTMLTGRTLPCIPATYYQLEFCIPNEMPLPGDPTFVCHDRPHWKLLWIKSSPFINKFIMKNLSRLCARPLNKFLILLNSTRQIVSSLSIQCRCFSLRGGRYILTKGSSTPVGNELTLVPMVVYISNGISPLTITIIPLRVLATRNQMYLATSFMFYWNVCLYICANIRLNKQ